MVRTLKDCLNEVGVKDRKFVPISKNHPGIIYYKVHWLNFSRQGNLIGMSIQEFYDPTTLPKDGCPPTQDIPTKQTIYNNIFPHLWDSEYIEKNHLSKVQRN